MKSSLRKDGERTAYLVAREEYRAELRISLFRTGFILILLAVNAARSLASGISLYPQLLPLLILLGLSIFMLADIWWLGRSRLFIRFYKPAHKYLIIILDTAGFSVLIYLLSAHSDVQSWVAFVDLPPDLMVSIGFLALFGVYIILDLLRFSVGSSYFTLLMFNAGFATVFVLLSRGEFQADIQRVVLLSALFTAPALAMTLISAYVSRRVAHMVRLNSIQQQLERYLPPALTRESLEKSRIPIDEGFGHRGPAAVLFADIRGFTAMSESLPPQEVVEFLNEYFNEMVEAVFENGGTLDKFIGDEIMVLYGTPMFRDDYCDKAVLTAVEMMDRLSRLNERRRVAGKEELRIGIGIHRGDVVFGSIGGRQRRDFTAIGDTVNTASRLQSISRKLDSDIIISEDLLNELNKKTLRNLELKDYGRASVRGKQKPFRIYGLRIPGMNNSG